MMPITVVYDDETSNRDAAVGGFYRMLEQAEQAGLMNTGPADISYGEPRDTVEFAPHWEGYLTQPSDDDRAAALGTGTARESLPRQTAGAEFAGARAAIDGVILTVTEDGLNDL